MVDNKSKTTSKLIGMATNMFSAEKDEVRAFLGAWKDYLYIFKQSKTKSGRTLERLIEDLKEYAEERHNIIYEEIIKGE